MTLLHALWRAVFRIDPLSYLSQRGRYKARASRLYVIEAIVLLAELLNIPFGFFFHISPKNVFIYESFFGGLRVFIYVYIFLACLMALYARQTKSLGKYVPTAMIVLMLITDYTTLYLIEDLSTYAITRAMMLGFLHMAILNEEFYGKDGDTE